MSRFNLDTSIAAWRQNLERSGSFLDEDLDELESHLRDHVAALAGRGRSEEEAFRTALERMGARSRMEAEFRKVRFGRHKRQRSFASAALREWELNKNYLVTALRNVRRNKIYALINVCGLAVGIGACLLIGLYVDDELAYDRFHENADRIAIIGKEAYGARSRSTPYPLASALADDLPDVARGVRILPRKVKIRAGAENRASEHSALYTNPAFLDVFSFPFLSGSPSGALDDPNSAILARGLAERLFGGIDVVGRTILLDFWGEERALTVTGVAENPPDASTLGFELVIPTAGLPDDLPQEGSWGASMYFTYVLLTHSDAFSGLEERINSVVDRHDGRDEPPSYVAVPLTDFYLSDLYPTGGFRGSRRYVYIFTSVALLILLIAGINYVNLSTALATRRTREVGVRKTLGAERLQLVRQFLAESVIISSVALVFALGWSRVALSGFNHLFGKDLSFTPDLTLAALCAGTLGVGIAAGVYPAVLLSRLRPMQVLSGSGRFRFGGKARLRQGLIALQFAVSVALIVGTAVVHQQLEFVQTKHLGFDGEQVAAVNLRSSTFWRTREAVQDQALTNPAVLHATVANAAPASFNVRLGFRGEEISPAIRQTDDMIMFAPAIVDYDFVETLGVKVIAGRGFSRERGSDATQAYILNETAVERLGWTPEEAIGKPFGRRAPPEAAGEAAAQTYGEIIGVVEDFHLGSLRKEIDPVVLQLRDDGSWSSAPILLAKLSPDAIPQGLAHLEGIVKRVTPDAAFSYEFLDDRFDAMYREEERLGRIFSTFAALAVFLACLGLFGLSAYAAQSRTKEIGIRKVLGASMRDVIALLSRSFLTLVAIGFVVAAPVSYWLMSRWLEDFAYRIDISPLLIVVVGVLTLALAFATVVYQAGKAALTDPVESLRYE